LASNPKLRRKKSPGNQKGDMPEGFKQRHDDLKLIKSLQEKETSLQSIGHLKTVEN